MIGVVLIGSNGKMGKCVQEALSELTGFQIVGHVHRGDNLDQILKSTQPKIAIDVSSHQSVKENAWCIVKNGVRPVIGASGLSMKDMEDLGAYCQEHQMGGAIAPNFSLAMAILNRTSKEFAKYYQDVSIVEYHHAQKKDKPSGTARHTAEIFGLEESQIASVRSNGFLAKQQIYIHSASERIILDHESFHRNSFTKGIQICAQKVLSLKHLVVGLENIF